MENGKRKARGEEVLCVRLRFAKGEKIIKGGRGRACQKERWSRLGWARLGSVGLRPVGVGGVGSAFSVM